jgi:hypothetical protein
MRASIAVSRRRLRHLSYQIDPDSLRFDPFDHSSLELEAKRRTRDLPRTAQISRYQK